MAKRKRKTNTMLNLVTIGVSVILSVGIMENCSQIVIEEKKQEEYVLKIIEQEKLERDLIRLEEMSNTRDYIEKIARERLGFVYPDEFVIYDISGK